jgi:hypothetical protein
VTRREILSGDGHDGGSPVSEERKDIHGAVRERILLEPGFYDAIIEDPRTALREGIGVDIPSSVGIRVYRQTPERLHIVLPFAHRPEPPPEESQ